MSTEIMETDSSGGKVVRTGEGDHITLPDSCSQANSLSTAVFGTFREFDGRSPERAQLSGVDTALQNFGLPSAALPSTASIEGVRLDNRAEFLVTTGQVSLQSGESYFLGDNPSQSFDIDEEVSISDITFLSFPPETETGSDKKRKDGVVECQNFSFQIPNPFSGGIKSTSDNIYVYGGSGQGAISLSLDSAGDTLDAISVCPDPCGSKDIPSGPWDAGLQPKPAEQIGPPADIDGGPGLTGGPHRAGRAVKLDVLDLSNSNCGGGEEGARLLEAGSVSSAGTSGFSKRFVQGSLRYKAKCRKFKFMVVIVCYWSLFLLVLTVRNLRSGTDELEVVEDYDEADYDLLGIREKRYATRLLTTSIANNSDCPVAFDENHNEIYIMSYDTFMSGGWVAHVIIGMYTFAAIAAICDIYFVPSLEHICEDLKLEADVAGATFMAAASSAPEFCTSVIGIFVQENDVGLGAIVGSSIFNLLAIVGLCALFAGAPVELSWYPLTRDSIFYTVAVFEMLAFMYDSIVHWYEALVMIMTYALYILVMVYNKKIEMFVNATDARAPSTTSSLMHDIHRSQSARLEIIRARSHSRASSHLLMSATRLRHLGAETTHDAGSDTPGSIALHSTDSQVPQSSQTLASQLYFSPNRDSESTVHEAVDGTSADPKKMAFVVDEVSVMEPTPHASEVMDEGEESAVAEYENPLEFPEGCFSRIYWITVLPMTVLHAFTIPDSRIQNSWQSKFYMIPFALSVMYLAIYSYIMVWAMSVAAWALNIPATVTGLTILAAGTSVPDCLSSIFVARDGYGDMAVSNAIGSNVFDILLCLGVPWLATSITEYGHNIDSEGMWAAGSTLVITILYLILSLKICNWTLTPPYGVLTLLVYFVVIMFCILVELNIIFNLKTKVC